MDFTPKSRGKGRIPRLLLIAIEKDATVIQPECQIKRRVDYEKKYRNQDGVTITEGETKHHIHLRSALEVYFTGETQNL